jgi:hypothetical protein
LTLISRIPCCGARLEGAQTMLKPQNSTNIGGDSLAPVSVIKPP